MMRVLTQRAVAAGAALLGGAVAVAIAVLASSAEDAPAAAMDDGLAPTVAPSLAIDGYEVLEAGAFEDAVLGVALRADRNGHFRLEARVNGRRLPFLVDTGASYVALNYEDARRVGIRLSRSDFRHEVATANGRVDVAAVRLRSIEYRSIRMRDVVAMVLPRGAMEGNLLGNSFLSRLRTFRIEDGELIMR